MILMITTIIILYTHTSKGKTKLYNDNFKCIFDKKSDCYDVQFGEDIL